MPERLVAVDFAERTDPGRDPSKQVNEDSCGYKVTPLGHLAVVCDGMGGHEGGREASMRAVAAIFAAFERGSFEASQAPRGRAALLKSAIEEANREVFALAAPTMHARPGSTVVAILVHPGGADVAWVGDSRVYLVHGSQVTQVTRDHSLVESLVAAGALTPEQAAQHPDANQILRARGMKADVEVDLSTAPVPFVAGDAFILCSDGMSDLVKPEDLLQIVGTAPAAQVAGQLVDLANARGGHDNITVQVLRVRESSDVSTKPIAPTIAEPIAQTIVDAPAGSPPNPGRTTYVPPVSPVPVAPRAAGSPTAGDDDHEPAHQSPAVIIGVVIALAGLVLAGIAIHLQTSRKSKHDTSVAIDLDGGAPPPQATLSEPTAIPSAPPAQDAGALQPLAPPAHSHHHHSGPPPTGGPDIPLPPVPTSTSL